MTVIGIDDTDSRQLGMCTTYVATRVAEQIAAAGGTVERLLLVRLNPAVEHKTRGNAALAIHCDLDPERALDLVDQLLDLAETDDERTNPAAVVSPQDPAAVPEELATFARDAVQDHHERSAAQQLRDSLDLRSTTRGNGRGLIGALSAVGAWRAFEEWTYECISYRERDRWGTDRDVDEESVFAAAETGYPSVWDTVDREECVAVCVPRTPCPILHGIRGDDPETVNEVARAIEGEPVAHRQLFVTNQGTDAHLQDGTLDTVRDGRSYRVTGTVTDPPETREGGHVFLTIGEDKKRQQLAAFEPTKRFRARVRNLRVGDRITACGELTDGTLKLEKFAVRELRRTEQVTPDCPDCGRSMKSAGRNAGYRCRDCKTSADGLVEQSIDRDLDLGWYEVPPCARRHIAKPLVRGGFDAPTHPER